MTDYEQRTLNEIERQIELNRQCQSCVKEWQSLNELRKEEQYLIWQYKELQDIYYISHLEICQNLNGNIMPNKKQILEEVRCDEWL